MDENIVALRDELNVKTDNIIEQVKDLNDELTIRLVKAEINREKEIKLLKNEFNASHNKILSVIFGLRGDVRLNNGSITPPLRRLPKTH